MSEASNSVHLEHRPSLHTKSTCILLSGTCQNREICSLSHPSSLILVYFELGVNVASKIELQVSSNHFRRRRESRLPTAAPVVLDLSFFSTPKTRSSKCSSSGSKTLA
jgi:hypothetical protein